MSTPWTQDRIERYHAGISQKQQRYSIERWQEAELAGRDEFTPLLEKLLDSDAAELAVHGILKLDLTRLIPKDFEWVYQMSSDYVVGVMFRPLGSLREWVRLSDPNYSVLVNRLRDHDWQAARVEVSGPARVALANQGLDLDSVVDDPFERARQEVLRKRVAEEANNRAAAQLRFAQTNTLSR